jgi:methionyl-tRNA formyltransferase
MKRTVFIGNRSGVWEEIGRTPDLALALTVVPEGSFLQRNPRLATVPHRVVATKREAIQALETTEFDLLVSNGCPFVLPIGTLRRPGRLFLNAHPSLLPRLRGAHPINGALLFPTETVGATVHHMDDGVDTGAIIAQREMPLTPDVDLGLLYHCLFRLEAEVFRDAMARLRSADYANVGDPQRGPETSYSRTDRDLTVDLAATSRSDFLRRVRAFGIRTQGIVCHIDGRSIRVFEAEAVDNSYFLAQYAGCPCGSLALAYDGKLIVRAADALVKIKSYSWLTGDAAHP